MSEQPFEPSATGRYYQVNFPIGEGKTDYEKYLRTTELLSLQKTREEAASPEEMLFQITHQTAELWMKQMIYEFDKALEYLAVDKILMACRNIRLANSILKIMTFQVDQLGENLSIVEYGKIRTALGQGSGMESPGFNMLLEYPAKLDAALKGVLTRKDVKLKEIYTDYEKNVELHTFVELVMDFDDILHKWRNHHFALAARTIGTESNSLKGIATAVLQKGAKHRFFPELLQLRSDLTNESGLAYGGQPLDQ